MSFKEIHSTRKGNISFTVQSSPKTEVNFAMLKVGSDDDDASDSDLPRQS